MLINFTLLQDALKSEHSGAGISFYESGVKCPRFIQLQKRFPLHVEGMNQTALDTGIVLHKLQELYHKDLLSELVIEDSDFNDDSPISEGVRLFKFYRSVCSPTFWGKPEIIEVGYPRVDVEGESAKLSSFWGVEQFTFRPDLVVSVTEEDTARVNERYSSIVLTPGTWIIDWKTAAAKEANAELKYKWRTQFAAYAASLVYLHPELNIQGTLAIKLIKHKTLELFDKNGLPHSLQPFVVPAPTSEDVTAIKQWLQYAEKEIKSGEPRLHNCVTQNGVCEYLRAGLCDRNF